MSDTLEKKTLELIATNWLRAFNDHDLESLLALYTEDAQHYSPKLKLKHPETKGYITGKAALRAWWKDAFETLPTLSYHMRNLTANNDRVFMEYIRKVHNDSDMLVAEVLEIKGDLIVGSRVYHG